MNVYGQLGIAKIAFDPLPPSNVYRGALFQTLFFSSYGPHDIRNENIGSLLFKNWVYAMDIEFGILRARCESSLHIIPDVVVKTWCLVGCSKIGYKFFSRLVMHKLSEYVWHVIGKIWPFGREIRFCLAWSLWYPFSTHNLSPECVRIQRVPPPQKRKRNNINNFGYRGLSKKDRFSIISFTTRKKIHLPIECSILMLPTSA